MDAQKQIRQRLESLKAAGIEYLPRPAASLIPVPPVVTAVPPPTHSSERILLEEVQTMLQGDVRQSLDVLAKEVAGCKRCPELYATRTQTVFGVGKLAPDLCFVGEAPGADEDAKGEP